MTESEISLALIADRQQRTMLDVAEIKTQMQGGYVRLERFIIVERLVFGLVGLALIAMMGAIFKLVIQ